MTPAAVRRAPMASTSAQVRTYRTAGSLVGGGYRLSRPGRQFQFGSPRERKEYAVVAVVVFEAADRGQPEQVAVKPRGSSEISRGPGRRTAAHEAGWRRPAAGERCMPIPGSPPTRIHRYTHEPPPLRSAVPADRNGRSVPGLTNSGPGRSPAMTDPIAPVTGSVISNPDAQTAIWFLGALSQVRVSGAQPAAPRGGRPPRPAWQRQPRPRPRPGRRDLLRARRRAAGLRRRGGARRRARHRRGAARRLRHAYVVTSATARFLTLHTPAGFEQFAAEVGQPAGPSPCRRHPPDRQISPRWPRLPPGTRSRSWPRRPSPEPAGLPVLGATAGRCSG